jgi:hypothetical protein
MMATEATDAYPVMFSPLAIRDVLLRTALFSSRILRHSAIRTVRLQTLMSLTTRKEPAAALG